MKLEASQAYLLESIFYDIVIGFEDTQSESYIRDR